MLDSLEQEYKRDEDWCCEGTLGDKISQLITKHQEQKEAFLKACTLARRTAETYLKYTSRSLQYYNYPQDADSEASIKGRCKCDANTRCGRKYVLGGWEKFLISRHHKSKNVEHYHIYYYRFFLILQESWISY